MTDAAESPGQGGFSSRAWMGRGLDEPTPAPRRCGAGHAAGSVSRRQDRGGRCVRAFLGVSPEPVGGSSVGSRSTPAAKVVGGADPWCGVRTAALCLCALSCASVQSRGEWQLEATRGTRCHPDQCSLTLEASVTAETRCHPDRCSLTLEASESETPSQPRGASGDPGHTRRDGDPGTETGQRGGARTRRCRADRRTAFCRCGLVTDECTAFVSGFNGGGGEARRWGVRELCSPLGFEEKVS